jgi:LacI family transcriptional regulator
MPPRRNTRRPASTTAATGRRLPAARRPAVALLIETSNGYARGLLEGIIGYLRDHDPWLIALPEQRRGESPPAWLKRWNGDGIIARIETPEIARAIARTGLPTVDVSAARPLSTVPWVETDDAAIARLAFDHFLQRGLKRLAFVGDGQFKWSQFRQHHFVSAAEAHAIPMDVFAAAPQLSALQRRDRLRRWLLKLPRPCGVFACYDIQAQQVLDLCRELSLRVPEDLAVLGVDNDPLLCNLCSPPLSSVIPDSYLTGYTAAALLTAQLQGQTVPPQATLIPPLGVETRRSTDMLAIEDTEVARALAVIRERACEAIDVADVLRQVGISRRVLESRFRRWVGHTPHAEIVRVRLDRVQQLLLDTDLPLAAIADRTGFAYPEYLSAVFRRQHGMSPSEYRRQHSRRLGGTSTQAVPRSRQGQTSVD